MRKAILVTGLVIFAITLLAIPVTYTGGMRFSVDHHPVWAIQPHETVEYGQLFTEWAAIVVITGGLMMLPKAR